LGLRILKFFEADLDPRYGIFWTLDPESGMEKIGSWINIRNTEKSSKIISVADPGCLSRIPDPDFCPSRIPDPKPATKERGEKKFDVITFYVATNFTKWQSILVLKC
jgi:hypothetical protein